MDSETAHVLCAAKQFDHSLDLGSPDMWRFVSWSKQHGKVDPRSVTGAREGWQRLHRCLCAHWDIKVHRWCISVDWDLRLHRRLRVDWDLSMHRRLRVDGDLRMHRRLRVDGDLRMHRLLRVDGDLRMHGVELNWH